VNESRNGAVEASSVDGGKQTPENGDTESLTVHDESDLRFFGAGARKPMVVVDREP
jgi:hypothetical protein